MGAFIDVWAENGNYRIIVKSVYGGAILTLPRIQLGERKVDILGKTQKRPTHRSANARFARKKFVRDRIRMFRKITKSTNRFPVYTKCYSLKV